MKLVKVLKLLICFVLIVPLFATNASANTNYNHSELLEYEGYGEAMYESIVEQTTFLTGQYTDNKEYVSNSIDEIVDYANFWKDDFENWDESCNDGFTGCMRSMLENGTGYLLTVGDWFKNLWGSVESETQHLENPIYDSIIDPVRSKSSSAYVLAPYVINVDASATGGSASIVVESGGSLPMTLTGYPYDLEVKLIGNGRKKLTREAYNELYAIYDQYKASPNISSISAIYSIMGYSLTITTEDGEMISNPKPYDPTRPQISSRPPITSNDLDDVIGSQIPTPQPKPYLVCPDGTKIQMSISGSTFLSVNGEVMLVDKDGTANVNNEICNLNWQKQDVKYLDGRLIVEDLNDDEGNFKDMLCVLGPANCQPISKEEANVENLDKSLLQYVKNSYEYATGFLKTATDGLKSLATGAKDLTSLFGTFFSWLPNEMVVLMASGLGITVGLRLFRK